ncbi:MAG: hypothetical protein ABSG36_19120 [Acidimicrobiales bacterium]
MTASRLEPATTSQFTVDNERMPLHDPATLPEAFDAAASCLKLVVLVSPTCPICLDGVGVVRDSLAELDSAHVSVYVLWVPVLKGDTPEAAQDSARLFGSTVRAVHYWDDDRALSSRYCDLLGLKERGRSVAWDLYLIYDKGTRWSAGPPMPKVWMQQLLLDDVPELEQTALVSQLRQRLEKTDP